MIDKNCLIIDDEAGYQRRIFEKDIFPILHQKGINANLILVDTTEKDLQTNEKIDLGKLKNHIEEKIKCKKIDVVACDYELSSKEVNGIDVIKKVRELRSKVKIFLYSGKYDKIIGDILKEFKSDDPKTIKTCIHAIKTIYNSNIEEFIERNDYPSRIKGILLNECNSIDDIFLQKILEHSNLKFKSCYPKFEGKTLLEIAEEIDKNSIHGQQFLSELVELTVAHLIEINNE